MSTYPEPGPSRPRRRGRPAKIDRQAIVEAAIALGLDRFSMQAVADRLGVTAPALYSHVANRDEVVALAEQALRRRLGAVASDAADWRSWLHEFAVRVRDALGDVPPTWKAEVPADGSGDEVVVGERGLQLLIEAGLSPLDAAHAMWLTYRIAVTAGSARGPGFGRYVDGTGAVLDASAVVGHRLPATGSVHEALVAAGPHDTFDFDLAVLLDGVAARLRAAQPHEEGSPP